MKWIKLPDGEIESENGRGQINAFQVGEFKPKTKYDLVVDRLFVGVYDKLSDAKRVGEDTMAYNDEQTELMDKELAWEFDTLLDMDPESE